MDVVRRIGLFSVAAGLVAAGQSVAVAAPTASAHDREGPVVTPLAEVGSDDFVIGARSVPTGRSMSRTAWPVRCCASTAAPDT
jgi:hypothetical protein